jgi:hypothetical protein
MKFSNKNHKLHNTSLIMVSKTLIIISMYLMCSMVFAQQSAVKKDKLLFHSFSITPLEAFVNKYSGGIAISGDLSYALNKDIFTFSATTGAEIAIFGRAPSYNQLNILYGREFEFTKWLFVDTHAGIGVFFRNDSHNSRLTAVGIPLVTKLRFKTGDKFSIGFKFQGNINSIENIYSAGLLLQWNY